MEDQKLRITMQFGDRSATMAFEFKSERDINHAGYSVQKMIDLLTESYDAMSFATGVLAATEDEIFRLLAEGLESVDIGIIDGDPKTALDEFLRGARERIQRLSGKK